MKLIELDKISKLFKKKEESYESVNDIIAKYYDSYIRIDSLECLVQFYKELNERHDGYFGYCGDLNEYTYKIWDAITHTYNKNFLLIKVIYDENLEAYFAYIGAYNDPEFKDNKVISYVGLTYEVELI